MSGTDQPPWAKAPREGGRFAPSEAGPSGSSLSRLGATLEVAPCLGADWHIVSAVGFGADVNHSARSEWTSLTAGALARLPVSAWFALRAQLDVSAALVQPDFVIHGAGSAVSALGLLGSVGFDAKVCPDGSSVGRTGPNCEFAPCPDEEIACPADAKLCADGSSVSRQAPDCEFAPCPNEEIACDADARSCPDGSTVSRVPPSCEFAACPEYDPCSGKTCGETCTLCPPDAVDCGETAVLKMCDASGSCDSSQPSCE